MPGYPQWTQKIDKRDFGHTAAWCHHQHCNRAGAGPSSSVETWNTTMDTAVMHWLNSAVVLTRARCPAPHSTGSHQQKLYSSIAWKDAAITLTLGLLNDENMISVTQPLAQCSMTFLWVLVTAFLLCWNSRSSTAVVNPQTRSHLTQDLLLCARLTNVLWFALLCDMMTVGDQWSSHTWWQTHAAVAALTKIQLYWFAFRSGSFFSALAFSIHLNLPA